MQILYVGMRHEYGDPQRGRSFEEMNFRSSLEAMGHELTAFDFMARGKERGFEQMRAELVDVAARTGADLAFFFIFSTELDTAAIEGVGQAAGCPTVGWFADDHWRFKGHTRHLAPAFDLCVTTDAGAVAKYGELDGARVLLSQWACNPRHYHPTGGELCHEVTFVGQPHGERRKMAQRLARAGHAVECWGYGWPNGPLDHERMVEVFSTSRVNLNTSNSPEWPGRKARLRRRLGIGPSQLPRQIKGRNFEVPACGGFLLTEQAPGLERYFVPGAEIGVFEDLDDLLAQLPEWLADEDRRARVADAGRRRVLAEHTYEHRFAEIFAALGLGGR
jgi:spore maturation protein CgeB